MQRIALFTDHRHSQSRVGQAHACSDESVDAHITALAAPEGPILRLQVVAWVPGGVYDYHPAHHISPPNSWADLKTNPRRP